MKTLSALCLAIALASGTAACVSNASPAPLNSEEQAPDVLVRIINHRFNDVTVYANLGARRTRLGYASGKRTSVFRIPWKQTAGIENIRLSIDSIGGGGRASSSPMAIQPGTLVTWELQPDPYSTN
jgi:outer membrane biogenesis lipoprotein LolB